MSRRVTASPRFNAKYGDLYASRRHLICFFTCLEARTKVVKTYNLIKGDDPGFGTVFCDFERTISSSGSPDSGHTFMTAISGIRGTMA
jgi:hypothetical protein